MDDKTCDVIRIYGDTDCQNTQTKPAPLQLPKHSPKSSEIIDQRLFGGLTQLNAAKLCGVTKKTWQRWESGKIDMPKATWGWFLINISGGIAAGGPSWENWSFHDGKLYSHEGHNFTSGELRSWPYLHALMAEQRKQIKDLQMKLDLFQRPNQSYNTGKAVGQLDALGMMSAQLMTEYENSENSLLQHLSKNLHEALKNIISAKAPLIKTTNNNGN